MKYSRYSKGMEVSYCFGIYPAINLLESRPDLAVELFISSKLSEGAGATKLLDLADAHGVPVSYNDVQIDKLTPNDSVTVVAVFKSFASKIDINANHLVLVNPSDMGNLGTILRTCAAFDVLNLALIKPCADILDPKVVRASMGTLFSLNVEYFDTFEDYVFTCSPRRNYYLFMTDGEQSLAAVKIQRPFSLVFGNEGEGLDVSYKTKGTTVFIPQSSKVDSLNLAVSVAISLYATAA